MHAQSEQVVTFASLCATAEATYRVLAECVNGLLSVLTPFFAMVFGDT